jgi:molybdopterin converting factor subunit 1
MRLHLLYFARLRERFGCAEETLEFDGACVADLVTYLQARGGVWAEEFDGSRAFRVAVNQDIVTHDTALPEHAEVAIFPPVTGG